jgi:phospholipid-binding lipoprotein MlaA
MPTFIPRAALTRIAVSLLSLTLVAGCATPPPADDKESVAEFEQLNDPLEPMNRAIFEFNQVVDRAMLKPLAQGYRAVVPPFGRERVRDFLNNLRSPVIFANDLLQGEPDRAVQTAMRFAFNTGFGAVGLFDVAASGGIPYHDEDFGQTFAVWGIGEGPYLVFPILGPSNPRDIVGLAAEWLVDPLNLHLDHVGQDWAIWTRTGMYGIDKRERYLDKLNEIERGSLDYYASLRSLYRQIRTTEVKNGTVDLRAKPEAEKR